VRALNLIPVEQRRGSSDTSPYGVYGLLGGLALVLAAVTLFVTTSNRVTDSKAQLAKVTTEAAAAKAQARRLVPYTNFADLQQKRLATVKSLASTRFAWSRAFSDVSHVIGTKVWLNGLTGTVAPGMSVANDATADTSTVRAAASTPAIALTGCARTTDSVASLMSRLRAMTGVQRVSLVAATKDDTATPQQHATKKQSSGSDTQNCGSIRMPKFSLVVFYAPLKTPSASPSGVDPAAATASATTSTTPSSDSSGTSTTSTTSTTASGTTP
jgi:Tfp pilus assembly protein PilN